MPRKELHVTMPDGSVWAVPCFVIADHRARFFDEGEVPSYNEEYDYTIRNNGALLDWAANEMNWDEVEHVARQVLDPDAPDFQEGWVNGPKEIVEVDDNA